MEIAATAALSTRLSPEASPHHGLALLAHHGENVSKIQIDKAFLDDKVADAGYTRIKHPIGQGEGMGERSLFVGHPEQVLVWDDQQGVHHLQQFGDAGFGKAHATLALEVEWFGDYTDGVRMPSSRAALAMMGAAPVPVPPPMPAVTNTMCAPVGENRGSHRLPLRLRRTPFRAASRRQGLRSAGYQLDDALGQ